ncbi:MAG: DUF86 domain-containing protein [Promethearchaeota archaeon]|nr:MAG: DUF86 domain-containing protein [Candidatus Lokiarchaeota archaeon]
MKKKDIVYIKHIRDAIELILNYTKDLNESDFSAKVMVQDAVIRRIQVIGEAVKNVSTAFREKYGEIPWTNIAGMRDKITHGYFNVDIDIVWKVIVKDIPILKKGILEIIKKEEKNINNNISVE